MVHSLVITPDYMRAFENRSAFLYYHLYLQLIEDTVLSFENVLPDLLVPCGRKLPRLWV